MNAWLWFAVAFSAPLLPALWVLSRAEPMERLIALQFATGTCVLILVMIAAGSGRGSYLDAALTLALLSYPSTLLFGHFLERWL